MLKRLQGFFVILVLQRVDIMTLMQRVNGILERLMSVVIEILVVLQALDLVLGLIVVIILRQFGKMILIGYIILWKI